MKVHSKSRTKKILACTWIIPIIVASPYLFYKSYPFIIFSDLGSISRQICTDRFDQIDLVLYGEAGRNSGRFRKGFFFFLFIAIYLVPLLVILSTCVRIAMRLLKPIVEKQESAQGQRITRKREENKRRVARMIIVVAVAFIVAWSPFYLVTFISQVQTMSFLRKSNYIFVMLAVHLVGFINSCINPFIYNFMSDKFRKSFAQIMLSMCCLCVHVPFLRKCFAVRTHTFRHRGSEYDQDYSVGEFSRTAATQHSPLESETRFSSGRCRFNSSGTPNSNIIRLSSLNSHGRAIRGSTSSPEHKRPLPAIRMDSRLSNGTVMGGGSHDNSGSPRKTGQWGHSGGTESVLRKDLHTNSSPCPQPERTLLTETCVDQSQQDLDLDTDLYDQPTSNLLRNSQDKI